MSRWSLLWLGGLIMTAAAITYQPINLNQAVQLALRFNPQVNIAGLRRLTQQMGLDVIHNQTEWQYALGASSQYTWAKNEQTSSAGQIHQLQMSGQRLWSTGANTTLLMTNPITNPNGSHNAGSYNPGLSLNLNQPLWRGVGSFITLSPVANAEDQDHIQRLNRQQTVIDTIVKVAIDYENEVLAQQNLRIERLSLAQVTQHLTDLTIEIEAGTLPAADRIQAQADLANTQLNLSSAQYSLSQSHLQLLEDIGVAPSTPISIVSQQNIRPHVLPTPTNSIASALAFDVNYQSLLINRRIDQRNLDKALDDQRPQLNVTISGTTGNGSGPGANLASLVNHHNEMVAIGLNLSVPIDDLPLRQQGLNARVQIAQDDIDIRHLRWQLQSTVIEALHNLSALQHQWRLAQQAADQQQKTLMLAQQRLRFGMGSALDISTQQKNLTQARLTVSSTQIGYFLAWLQLRQLLGQTLADFGVRMQD